MGESNGGRTIASVMLQKPHLFGCVVCCIPVLDMLNYTMNNYEYREHGFIDNFGDYNNLDDFRNLYKISPLHNIQDGVEYPPMLILAQGEDKQAHPGHALKFLATLLDRASNDDFYLALNKSGGHNYLYMNNKYGNHVDYDIFSRLFTFIQNNLSNN